jgi:hypothetical protein
MSKDGKAPRTYIGIDPGQKGAIAFLFDVSVIVFDCPPTIGEMPRLLPKEGWDDPIALIEKVHPFYKSSAKSAFTFGENFGAWQAVLAANYIPYDFIAPSKWQKIMFDSAKKLATTKEQSFERASRLFPLVELKTKKGKILDGRCDALLLAELCRRLHS